MYVTLKDRVIMKNKNFKSEHNNQLFCISICDFGGSKTEPNDEVKRFEKPNKQLSPIERFTKTGKLEIQTTKQPPIVIIKEIKPEERTKRDKEENLRRRRRRRRRKESATLGANLYFEMEDRFDKIRLGDDLMNRIEMKNNDKLGWIN
jgi:hypothetical protein